MTRGRRGTTAIGAAALIMVFIILAAALTAMFTEFNRSALQTKALNEKVTAKNKESLFVQAEAASENVTLTVRNVGSTSSLIVKVVFLDEEGKFNCSIPLSPPLSVKAQATEEVVVQKTINDDWSVGVLTDLGNVFWATWPFNFSLTVAPQSGSVSAGNSTSATVTVSLISGEPETVTLSANQTSDITVSLNPLAGAPPFTSTVTISTSSSTPSGTYLIVISGRFGNMEKTANYTLTVT